jgi:hypothetical protein
VGAIASAIFVAMDSLERISERNKMNKLILLNTKALFSVILLGLLGCVSTGCGSASLNNVKEVPEVNGTVLLPTGKPLKGGQLIFRPVGGVKGSRKMYADINDDGTFVMKSDSQKQKIVASEYKVFVSLNGDPKYQSFRRLVPEKYRDVREDEYETDLFINLNEQTSGIVLKMTKG